MKKTWTSEDIEFVKLNARTMSGEAIAAHFRKSGKPAATVNAIAGLCRREGISLAKPATSLPRPPKPRRQSVKIAPRKEPRLALEHPRSILAEPISREPLGPAPQPVLRNGKRISFFDRDDKVDCPYPYLEEGITYYCGHPKRGKYCSYHEALVHQPVVLRRRSA